MLDAFACVGNVGGSGVVEFGFVGEVVQKVINGWARYVGWPLENGILVKVGFK